MDSLITTWDRIARKLMGIRPAAEGAVVSYALRRYRGRTLTTAEGFQLRSGDQVLELHLDSRLLAERTAGASPHRRSMLLRREMLVGLKALAKLTATDPKLAHVQGVWGLTLFHRGVEFFGFTAVELPPGLGRNLTTWYMRQLLAAYHPAGTDRLQQREESLIAKQIFLPRPLLLTRYGEAPAQ